jgi:hypothetical protein
MATHLPTNHPLRPLYRFLALLAGGYCLLFGIVGVMRASGHGFFAVSDVRALGLRTNTAFATLSILVGALVVVSTVMGRNVDHRLGMVAGPAFILVGILMLLLMDTTANFLNFGMSTCIVSFLIGMVIMAAGFYTRVGTLEEAQQEEGFRHSEHGDPHKHSSWGGDPTRTYEGDTDGTQSGQGPQPADRVPGAVNESSV